MALSPPSVAIVGGSIAGLAAATAFLRLGFSVRVFEAADRPFYGRGGSIGYCNVELWQSLRGATMIRRGIQASRSQGAFLYGDLWSFWYDGLPRDTVSWGVRVSDLGSNPTLPVIQGQRYDIAVIADGGWSELRTRYFGTAQPVYAGYVAWRFRVSAADVPGFQAFGEYGSEHYRTILLPVAQNDGKDFIMGGTAVFTPEEDLPAHTANVDPVNRQASSDGSSAASIQLSPHSPLSLSNFMALFRSKFGKHAGGEPLRAMEAAAARGKITPLPQHEFAAERVVKGRLLLVGDAAHMASPRTAAGAHTAVLDATELFNIFSTVSQSIPKGSFLSSHDIDRALALYAPNGSRRAAELLARSHQVSAEVVPAGWTRKLAD